MCLIMVDPSLRSHEVATNPCHLAVFFCRLYYARLKRYYLPTNALVYPLVPFTQIYLLLLLYS